MKKLFVLTIMLALFVACSESKPKIQTTIKPHRTAFKLNNESIDLGRDGIVTASNKHQFIIINNLMPNMNVLHDTDCQKCHIK